MSAAPATLRLDNSVWFIKPGSNPDHLLVERWRWSSVTIDGSNDVPLPDSHPSYDEYEAYRQQHPELNLPEQKKPAEPSDEAENKRNPNSGTVATHVPAVPAPTPLRTNGTMGRIYVMQMSPSPGEVRAPNESESRETETSPSSDAQVDTTPNDALQALINKANDTRSMWDKTKEVWGSAKRIGGATIDNPGDAGIGLLKGIGNLPSDMLNLAVMATKQQVGIDMRVQMMDWHAMHSYGAGDLAAANRSAAAAKRLRELGVVGDIFTLTSDAQKGGNFLSNIVPYGAAAKLPISVAKTLRGAKAVDAAADAAHAANAVRAADVSADAAKTANIADGVTIAGKPPLAAGTIAHKANRWEQYIKRKGKWSYERWAKQYETNMRNYLYGLAREAEYRASMGALAGTLKTPLTFRQIDILKSKEMYAGQLKTGPVSLTEINIKAIKKDAELVRQGWRVEHILEQGASRQYLEALKIAEIDVFIGSKIP